MRSIQRSNYRFSKKAQNLYPQIIVLQWLATRGSYAKANQQTKFVFVAIYRTSNDARCLLIKFCIFSSRSARTRFVISSCSLAFHSDNSARELANDPRLSFSSSPIVFVSKASVTLSSKKLTEESLSIQAQFFPTQQLILAQYSNNAVSVVVRLQRLLLDAGVTNVNSVPRESTTGRLTVCL